MDYTIKSGDTLSKIAQANKTDVNSLAKLNNISNPNIIQSGSVLKLPSTPLAQTMPENTNVNATTLGTTQALQLPQTRPSSVPVTNNVADTILQDLALTQNEQTAQKGQENIVAKMLENIAGQSGESAYRSSLLQGSNLNTLKQDLQGINSQILKKQAEIQQDDTQLIANMRAEERRDTLLPFAQMGQAKLAGDAQILRALKTSEIGVLNALAIGRQGDIQLAKETINEAVDAKYAPYKEQNALYKQQLEAIQPFLNSAEKKQATAQQFKLNQATKELDRVADFQKTVLSNAISNNAPQSVLNAIQKAGSLEEITKAGAGYLKSKADILDEQLKIAQTNSANRANRENQKTNLNSLLSIKEASDAGVPYGTTYGQLIAKGADSGVLTAERGIDRLNQVKKLSSPSVGLATSAGSLRGTPIPFFKKNAINNWRADAVNVMSRLTVDELGRVKADGVTFGGLSNGEREAVGAAASILLSGSVKDKEGNPTGKFTISEKRVAEAFKEIEKYQELDFVRRTGMTPEEYEAKRYKEQTEAAMTATASEYDNIN